MVSAVSLSLKIDGLGKSRVVKNFKRGMISYCSGWFRGLTNSRSKTALSALAEIHYRPVRGGRQHLLANS